MGVAIRCGEYILINIIAPLLVIAALCLAGLTGWLGTPGFQSGGVKSMRGFTPPTPPWKSNDPPPTPTVIGVDGSLDHEVEFRNPILRI